MQTYELKHDAVIATKEKHIATVTLNRPDSRNSLSDEMLSGIAEALDKIEADDEARVIVITGAGSGFCSGGDLKDMVERSGMFAGDTATLRDKYVNGVQANTRRLAACHKPLIAAVNGHAIGAGLGIALSCDIRVVSEEAKFGATFPKIGLIAGDGSAYLLQRAIGVSRAAELMISARVFDAEEAYRLGIAHEVTPREEVLASAYRRAKKVAELPSTAVKLTKSLFYQGLQGNLDTALSLASAYQVVAHEHPEHHEAVKKMLEKISSSS